MVKLWPVTVSHTKALNYVQHNVHFREKKISNGVIEEIYNNTVYTTQNNALKEKIKKRIA